MVQGAGVERNRWIEIYRGEGRCGSARRLRSTDGNASLRSDIQQGGRNYGRPEIEGVRAFGPLGGLPAGVDGGRASGFQVARGRGFDAWIGSAGGVRGRHLHAGQGAERDTVFPERIVRKVRALPVGFAKDGGYPHAMDDRKKHRGRYVVAR